VPLFRYLRSQRSRILRRSRFVDVVLREARGYKIVEVGAKTSSSLIGVGLHHVIIVSSFPPPFLSTLGSTRLQGLFFPFFFLEGVLQEMLLCTHNLSTLSPFKYLFLLLVVLSFFRKWSLRFQTHFKVYYDLCMKHHVMESQNSMS